MKQLIDMSQLPAPACIADVSFQSEQDYLLDTYTLAMREENEDPDFPRPLVSDPAYQILSTVAYRMGIRRQEINEACLATMLAYATGTDLDHIGANHGVERLVDIPADLTADPEVPAVMESDDRFRQRIQLKIESVSTAGASGAYEYHVLSVSTDIVGVFIDTPIFSRTLSHSIIDQPNVIALQVQYDARLSLPMPGDVAITVLLKSDADTALLDAILPAINGQFIRPVTDNPILLPAEVIEYEVHATLYFYPGPSPEPALEAAQMALKAYTDNMYQLGHDIAVSGLHGAAHQAAVQRVELNISSDIIIEAHQAARCTAITVSMGGRDV